jgi:hypothetical protein
MAATCNPSISRHSRAPAALSSKRPQSAAAVVAKFVSFAEIAAASFLDTTIADKKGESTATKGEKRTEGV